jgi:PST family polysaccharide transporter
VFATLGMAFMLGQFLANGAQLAARALIQQRLGVTELGLFQAAWAISTTYLGIVLQSLAADYYPRLSEAIQDPRTAARIVREQTEVALFLGAPIILGGLALAPLALQILYSSAFRPAAELLRWQVLGDVLKIAGWPMGYVLLAANRGRTFLLVEAVGWAAFLATTISLIPYAGLEAAGIGYLVMYVLYFPAVLMSARRITGPIWTLPAMGHMLIVAAAAVAVFVIAADRPLLGAIVGVAAAFSFAAVGATKLRERIRAENPA